MQNQYDVILCEDTGEFTIEPVRTPVEKVAFGYYLKMTGTYPECERYVYKQLMKRTKRVWRQVG
jgi:hypothetical protein